MTVTEVRDRLNDRFRLLVGSRRGLERHQTLRHAVQWSYDLLDEDEQTLLNRCSVFAGGFDLAGACAVAGSEDEFATLDLLDALVRKSLLVADRSSGRTRFSMLETIRQFAEDQLAAGGPGRGDTRLRMRDTSPTCEADVLALWDSPRQREAYDWFTIELANLRAAFRWAADHDDLDTAAAIALYAFIGASGRTVRANRMGRGAHRTRESRRTSAGSQRCTSWPASAVGSAGSTVPFGTARAVSASSGTSASTGFRSTSEASLGSPYIPVGQPERWAEVARRQLEHTDDTPRTRPGGVGHGAGARRRPRRGDRPDGRTRCNRLNPPTTRFRSRRCFSQSGWPTATPIRRPHWRPSGARWKSPRTAATASTNPTSQLSLSRPRSTTRLPRSRVRPPHAGDPQLPRVGKHRDVAQSAGHPRRPVMTDSVTMNRRPPSPISPPTP